MHLTMFKNYLGCLVLTFSREWDWEKGSLEDYFPGENWEINEQVIFGSYEDVRIINDTEVLSSDTDEQQKEQLFYCIWGTTYKDKVSGWYCQVHD